MKLIIIYGEIAQKKANEITATHFIREIVISDTVINMLFVSRVEKNKRTVKSERWVNE